MTLREWQNLVKPREELIYNCSVVDGTDGWLPFTIGLGYKFIGYRSDIRSAQIGTHDKLVMCTVSSTTDTHRRPTGLNRSVILSTLRGHNILNSYINLVDYFSSMPGYKFVISPEGNGIDCHRHYEALMAGCIPVVEDHPGIHEKYDGCPILFTKDYSECTHEYLTTKYEEMIDKEYDFSKLFLSTYSPEIQAKIKMNGNYWARRLTGHTWY
jgi:hypothetical protein